MSTKYSPYSPVGLEVQTEGVRVWRMENYSPLDVPQDLIKEVVGHIDEIVDASNIGRSYDSDRLQRQQAYDRSFTRRLGVGSLTTRLQVRNTTYRTSSSPFAETYAINLTHAHLCCARASLRCRGASLPPYGISFKINRCWLGLLDACVQYPTELFDPPMDVDKPAEELWPSATKYELEGLSTDLDTLAVLQTRLDDRIFDE